MFTYPDAHRADVADVYHGTRVGDPYRWLENPDSDETAAFVRAQNELSLPYLEKLPGREALASRMRELWNTPRTYAPTRRSGVTVWAHNDGLLNQPVYYVQQGARPATPLLDPNGLSEDGTVAINVTSLSPDGATFAYSVSEAGSDWQVIRFRDTTTGEDLADELRFVKFTSLEWHKGGIFYSRFPETDLRTVETARDPSVCFHEIGTDQGEDDIVFNNADDPDPSYDPLVTHDNRYLVLSEYLGTSRQNGLLYKDLDDPQSAWIRLVEPMVGAHAFLLHHQNAFVVRTDVDTPNGRIVSIPLNATTPQRELVPAGDTAIEFASVGDGHIHVVRLVEASHRLLRYSLSGQEVEAAILPGQGTVTAISGTFSDADVFVEYESFTHPPTALHLVGSRATVFGPQPLDAAHDDIVVSRQHCVSTDGATVGMFVLRRKDSSGPAPTDLYGYGGFSINMTPTFNPARLAFIHEGGVVVVANLRGGTELGEQWHVEGMLGHKQQTFDDFISCAEHLLETGVTTRDQLSISGRSNGGLLTMATMVQRPELFAAVVSHVPVADMLRFQHFTAGRYWTVEYGDAADKDAFAWLIDYSPLHNIDPDVDYPPTLLTTAEGDDRVVPMHSLKLIAELQHRAGGSSAQPLIVRVETRAGHGMGKPTAKLIEEAADTYAFVLHHCDTNR